MEDNLVLSLQPLVSRVRVDRTAKAVDGNMVWTTQALTERRLYKHVHSDVARGVCPIKEGEDTTRSALLDLDSHKGEVSWAQMVSVASEVVTYFASAGLHAIPWRSRGGKGIHLYFLWDQPQKAKHVRSYISTLLADLGYKNGTRGVVANEIEIFPKQDRVKIGGCGNQFILPLSGKSVPLLVSDGRLVRGQREDALSVVWAVSDDVPELEHSMSEKAPIGCKAIVPNLSELSEMLDVINSEDYDIWLKVGMILHHETQGDAAGLNVWDEWSQAGSNYKGREDLECRWSGFMLDRERPVTLRTLRQIARQHGWQPDILSAVNSLDPIQDAERIFDLLGCLDELEFDRCRREVAQRLGIRVSKLDQVVEKRRAINELDNGKTAKEPDLPVWDTPVCGQDLLESIYLLLQRFIICDEKTRVAATLWIAFTWFTDHVHVAPIAMITAPEKRCGKTSLLSVMSRLVRRPMVASNISPAAVYRVIEGRNPTLLIDEADTFLDDRNSEIGGILNSGHTRESAFVIRLVGEDFEPQEFSTWGAKAISGIGRRRDTIEDRSINLALRRRMPHETIEKVRHADPDSFRVISRKLARFAADNGPVVGSHRPELPAELNDRAQDNWEPLLAIADLVGGRWPDMARRAAVEISPAENQNSTLATQLLSDIKTIFETIGKNSIHSVDLISSLVEDDEKPWVNYFRDKPITPRQLANLLKAFSIHSKDLKILGQVRKGYAKSDFVDAFDRYLDVPSAIPLPAAESQDCMVAEMQRGSATSSRKATSLPLVSRICSASEDDFSDLC